MERKCKAAPNKQAISKTVKVEAPDSSDGSHLSSSAPVNLLNKQFSCAVSVGRKRKAKDKVQPPLTNKAIKENIEDLLSCHTKNPGDFVCTAILEKSKIGSLPLVYIGGYGVLPLPANELVVKDIMLQKHNLPGELQVLNKGYTDALKRVIIKDILPKLGLSSARYGFRMSELIILKPCDVFESKDIDYSADNPCVTMLIQLPSIFNGGDSIVEYNNMPRIFSTKKCDSSKDGLEIIAFYSDCSLKQKAITEGYRAFVIVQMYWEGIGPSPTAKRLSSNTERLAFLLNSLSENENKENIVDRGEVNGMLLGIPIDDDFSSQASRNLTALIRNAINYDMVTRDSKGWSLFEGSIETIHTDGNSFASLENRFDLRCQKYCFENVIDRQFPIDKLFRIVPDKCFI